MLNAMETTALPREPHDPAGMWTRIVWLDRQIREGSAPNVRALCDEFGVARRTVFDTLAYLRDSLGAPLEYDRKRKGYVYSEPAYALPALFLREGELLAMFVTLAERCVRGKFPRCSHWPRPDSPVISTCMGEFEIPPPRCLVSPVE